MDSKKTLNFIKKHWKLILAVLYLILPIDLIPDVLLPLGYTDDLFLVVSAVLSYLVKKKHSEKTGSKTKGDIFEGEISE